MNVGVCGWCMLACENVGGCMHASLWACVFGVAYMRVFVGGTFINVGMCVGGGCMHVCLCVGVHACTWILDVATKSCKNKLSTALLDVI